MDGLVFDQRFEISGKFWIPGSPDRAVDGGLRYDPGGFTTVNLMGALSAELPDDHRRLAIVHGRSMSGQELTLLGAAEGLEYVSQTGVRATVRAPCLLVGCHAQPETTQRFAAQRCRFSSMNRWYGKKLFCRKLVGEPLATVVQRSEAELGCSGRIESIAANYRIEVTEYSRSPSYGEELAGHHVWLRLEPDVPQELRWFDEQRRRLQRFLTLVVGDVVAVEEVQIRLQEQAERWSSYGFSDWLPPDRVGAAQRERVFLPFPFARVEKRLPALLDAWFDVEQRSGEALALLFSTMVDGGGAPLPYEFLSRVQAVEGVLRAVTAGTYVEPQQYDGIRDAMVKAMPEEMDEGLRAALKARLRFGNEWSLRRRLKEAFRSLNRELQVFVLASEKPASFVDAVVDGRNFWTHYDENEMGKPMSIPRASVASSRMLSLAVVLLLRRLGIGDEEILEQLDKNNAFMPFVGAYSYREFSNHDGGATPDS